MDGWGWGTLSGNSQTLKFLTLPHVNLNEFELVLVPLIFPGRPFKRFACVVLGLSHVMNQSTLSTPGPPSSNLQELERLLWAAVLASFQRTASCISYPQEVCSPRQRTDKLAGGPQPSIAESWALRLDSVAVSCLWEGVCYFIYLSLSFICKMRMTIPSTSSGYLRGKGRRHVNSQV